MLILTPSGLFCPAGNFYIDPSRGVENAVITHAHSDHARRGSQTYFSTPESKPLLRNRLSQKIIVKTYPYREEFMFGPVKVSFHSAGHILGSAQVRIEHNGEVWVVSGDYKREADPTCAPFEVVTCDVFVTEATFGTPAYRWNKSAHLGEEIFEWYQGNRAKNKNSVLFGYTLGKAQRILGVLEPFMREPVYCHPAATGLIECYREIGIKLAPTICLSEVSKERPLQGSLVLAPQTFLKTAEASQILGNQFETAFASGWMAQSRGPGFNRGYDKGFVMSDHADWDDLVQTVSETKAKRVYVQHRGHGALVKYLQSIGLEAFSDSKLIREVPNQLSLFEASP